MPTEVLIAGLAADANPVAPLPSPWRRASLTLAAIVAAGLVAIFLSDARGHLIGSEKTDSWLGLEMAAILVAGLLSLAGAFFAAVPGRSKLWLAAPVPFLTGWLLMTGAACYADLAAGGSERWRMGSSWHCLMFITGTSVGLAVPVTWLLAKAAPLYPGRVALLAGLGTAGLATFLLHFFHPFEVTAGDLTVHVGAVALVTTATAALRRWALKPA